MGNPQYRWRQGEKKSEWFYDKKMCLLHCKQHRTLEEPVYLYKRIRIPDGWVPLIMQTPYEEFRWKVKAFFATRQEEGDWTLQKGEWFDLPKDCLHQYKKMIQRGYDLADCWGTEHYLVMRRLLGERHRLYSLKLGRAFAKYLKVNENA